MPQGSPITAAGTKLDLGPPVADGPLDLGPPVGSGAQPSVSAPGFLTGLRESAGLPTWSQAKSYVSFAYRNPKAALQNAYKDFNTIASFAYDNPWKFMWMMTNIPMMRDAIHKGNYTEALGILAGTIPQALLVGSEAAKVAKATGTEFRAGLAGKTAEEIAAMDKLDEMSRATRIRLTKEESIPSGKLQRTYAHIQQSLRPFPFVGTPFEKLAEQRANLIEQFADFADRSARSEKAAGDIIYNKLREADPAFEVYQRQRQSLRDAWASAKASGDDAKAFKLHEALENLDAQIDEHVRQRFGEEGVNAIKEARRYWSKYHAARDIRTAIEGAFSGIEPEEQVIASSQPSRELAGKTLVARLKKLQQTPYGDLLERALGPEKEKELLSLAALYDRVQKNGRFTYEWVRLIGFAATMAPGAALGDVFRLGYLGDLAAGVAGSRIIASYLARGDIRPISALLEAADSGDIKRATAIAEKIGQQEAIRLKAEEARRERMAKLPPIKVPEHAAPENIPLPEPSTEPPAPEFTIPEEILSRTKRSAGARKFLAALRRGDAAKISPEDWKAAMRLTGVDIFANPEKLPEFISKMRQIAAMR